jgi:hypothetical protein
VEGLKEQWRRIKLSELAIDDLYDYSKSYLLNENMEYYSLEEAAKGMEVLMEIIEQN